MVRVMHEEPAFADTFMKFLLARSMRTQADLVDQLFNSSEKRLARILLLMAEFGEPGEPETFIPPVTQETLADMIGTTRSRVSFFMNRFRKLGFISYNGRIQVHKSLLNVILLDQLPGRTSARPPVMRVPPAEITRPLASSSSPTPESTAPQFRWDPWRYTAAHPLPMPSPQCRDESTASLPQIPSKTPQPYSHRHNARRCS